MRINSLFLRLPRLAASIALIALSALAISAQTTQQIVNLADFGPVGNGVADNGPAFQKALDALASAGGGTLQIPAGTFRIATPVKKDFSSVAGATVTIQGVPSTKMPAPVTANGNQLAEGLNLTSRIIPATGAANNTIQITNVNQLLIEHLDFTGTPGIDTDALIVLYFIDIDHATIRHCEFYGLSAMTGGNMVRGVRSELSIELSVFLGCTANSGVYAPVVENLDWRRFSISNSIFLDYGLREFFGKTPLAAPLSWVNIGNAAPPTSASPRREVIVRDTFLDEGGWVGISVLAHRFTSNPTPIDLLYISGLKMNVSNLATTGHLIYDVRNLMIENSHYGWSHNAISAIDINRSGNAILDKVTCIDHADRIHADNLTGRLTIINSVFETLDSQAVTTNVLTTAPEQDPVQYVRQQFATALGKSPDPAAHFYWSDLLIRCGSDNLCLNETRSALSVYLSKHPSEKFSLTGTVTDESSAPLSGVSVSLTGSQSLNALTDAQGKFRFSDLPTSGSYTVTVNKPNFTFVTATQNVVHPVADVNVAFSAHSAPYSIAGRITREDGTAISGVTLRLAEVPTTTVTSGSDGFFSFTQLIAGKTYTVVPVLDNFTFTPENKKFENLSENQVVNFTGRRNVFDLTGTVTDENGAALGGVTVTLTGSKSSTTVTDSQGGFRFLDLATGGIYTVTVEKEHYTFPNSSQTFAQAVDDVTVVFGARLNRHVISGRLTRLDGSGIGGVVVQIATATTTTDANGFYSFPDLPAGDSYTVAPASNDFVFTPANTTLDDLSANSAANFVGKLEPELIMIEGSELGIVLDAVSLIAQPTSFFDSLFTKDGFRRIATFAKNVEPVGPSQVTAVATDDNGQSTPLEVEFVGTVPGQSWLKQINLKLPANSLNGKCVQLRLTVVGVVSNNARICIGSQ